MKNMIPKHYAVALLSVIATGGASTMSYDFDDNDAVVDSNDFGSGITASDVTSTGLNALVTNERWQVMLRASETATFSFDVTIPDTVVIDLTNLSFDFIGDNMDTRFHEWNLGLSAGSSTPPQALYGPLSGAFVTNSESINLSGLTGLTDTTITFTLSIDNGNSYDAGTDTYSGGFSTGRNSVIDNLSLTGTVISEPTSPAVFSLRISPTEGSPGNYDFRWGSQDGFLYDLVSSTDLTTPPTDWLVWDGRSAIAGAAPENLLTDVPGGGDARRFFAMIEREASSIPEAELESGD